MADRTKKQASGAAAAKSRKRATGAAAKPKRAATAAKGTARKTGVIAEAAGDAAAAYLSKQREAAADAPEAAPRSGARRGADPLAGELRGRLLPLLVLHFMSGEPCYGNQLIDRVTELTGGVLTVNPNTMYPLLRGFEARGLIEGQWEHPERRSRRFYSLTAKGREELEILLPSAREELDSLARTIMDVRGELFG